MVFPVIAKVGVAFTVIVSIAEFTHPFVPVPETVYELVVPGDTEMLVVF